MIPQKYLPKSFHFITQNQVIIVSLLIMTSCRLRPGGLLIYKHGQCYTLQNIEKTAQLICPSTSHQINDFIRKYQHMEK